MLPPESRATVPADVLSEIRLHEARLDWDKLMDDMRQGFRITVEDLAGNKSFEHVDNNIYVVTKNADDFFTAEAITGQLYGMFHGRPDSFSRFDFAIRRRKKIPKEKGSATLERWWGAFTSREPLRTGYSISANKGGELDENEFIRRYNNSTVDLDSTERLMIATGEQVRSYFARQKGIRIRLSWIADETPGLEDETPTENQST